MPVYEIKPREGVGPVRLGTSRDDVRAAVPAPVDSFQKGAFQRYDVDAFDALGLHVHYTGPSPVVEFIEAFPADGVVFALSGLDLLGQTAPSVIAALTERHRVVEEEEEGRSYILPELDVALWRESPDDEVFASVGVGEEGYFGDRAV